MIQPHSPEVTLQSENIAVLERNRFQSKPKIRSNVFHAAERTAEFFDHLRAHYRETRRTGVSINASVRLVLEDGSLFDEGEGEIINISPSGALLSGIKTSKKAYPMETFKLQIVMNDGAYEGIGIEALPVRFDNESGGIGVKFEEIFVAA